MATGGTYGTNSTYGVPLAPSNSPPPGPLWYTHNVLFGALSGVSGDPPFALFTCIWTIWSVGWNSLMAAHAVPRIVRILKGGRHCKDLANALATCLLPHVVVGIIMPLVMSGLLGCAIGIVIPYGFAFRRAWREEIGSSDAPHDSRRRSGRSSPPFSHLCGVPVVQPHVLAGVVWRATWRALRRLGQRCRKFTP